MTDKTQDAPTLSVDGNNYPIDSLPTDIQELITCYQGWEKEMGEQKLELFKTEAAMRAVSAEIQSRVRQMTAAAADAKDAANEPRAESMESDETDEAISDEAVESEGGTAD